MLVTVTDLRHRVVHLTWQAGTPEVAPLVATQPNGRPVVHLPDRYRLASWAAVLNARPEDLRDADGGHDLDRNLRDGYVTVPWAGADPVAEHVRSAGRGTAAGRLIVVAAPPDAPPLPELLRLALGLDLALVVAVCDLRHNTGDPLLADDLRWSVEVKPRDAPVLPDDLPYRPSLAAALAWCREGRPTRSPARPRPTRRSLSRCPGPDRAPSFRTRCRTCCGSPPGTPDRRSPCASHAPAARCTDTTTTA
ncbi:hypothetical protein NKG94_26250 [Micromonospora sp. M12]